MLRSKRRFRFSPKTRERPSLEILIQALVKEEIPLFTNDEETTESGNSFEDLIPSLPSSTDDAPFAEEIPPLLKDEETTELGNAFENLTPSLPEPVLSSIDDAQFTEKIPNLTEKQETTESIGEVQARRGAGDF